MQKRTLICGCVLAVVLVSFLLFFSTCHTPSGSEVSQQGKTPVTSAKSEHGGQSRVLVFSKTAGYRHASIPAGIAALEKLGAEHHVVVDHTEDATAFNDENLARYRAVIFLSTSGNIFTAAQKAAFERYIEHGGGFVGIHSASDTEHHWAWYGQLVGAFFSNHPRIQTATIDVEDQHTPSTASLPQHWVHTDEWYNFATNPRPAVHVLLSVDEGTYTGGEMGKGHPIAWYHPFAGGRAWYTAIGHTSECFQDPLFLSHIWGGVMYAAGW